MKLKKMTLCFALCVTTLFTLQGCASNAEIVEPRPEKTIMEKANVKWPNEKLELDAKGVPTLSVYVVEDKKAGDIDIETYVQGVLAGEMKNDWPMEALKAQAILARTFVLKFVDEKESQYQNADISTDIKEAQAYDVAAVNDRIKKAVQETKGLVLSSNGELPYTWFHAHSGGMTALAKEGLGWEKAEPNYTRVVESKEPAPESVSDSRMLAEATQWKASFSLKEFMAACKEAGTAVEVNANSKITIGEKGKSGRAITILCDGKAVSAVELRIALDSTKMKSTLLTSIAVSGDAVTMEGKGYGHGVGMSQWGAYQMAEEGKTAKEIVMHYFKNAELAKLW